jgi:hypothetical protein
MTSQPEQGCTFSQMLPITTNVSQLKIMHGSPPVNDTGTRGTIFRRIVSRRTIKSTSPNSWYNFKVKSNVLVLTRFEARIGEQNLMQHYRARGVGRCMFCLRRAGA